MVKEQQRAAEISVEIMQIALEAVAIGVTGVEINELVGEECVKRDVIPAFRGVGSKQNPFPANLCIGINEQVLHAIPSDRPFEAGDLIKLDFGIIYKGYYTDHCVTVGLEPVTTEDKNLVRVGKLAVESAVDKVKAGIRVGDLGYIMQSIAVMSGYDVLRNYVGHGIGETLWLAPEIPAYGTPGSGAELKAGDVVCIEAQVVAGSNQTYVADDGWTISTTDGKNGVMFEYMVEVTPKGANILTDTRECNIFK